MFKKILTAIGPLAIAGMTLVHSAAQAAYPERPIRMIVAYSAGGATDVTARAIAPFIEKYLGGGARIVIENRTGAGGAIGFAALAAAPPDGYTIGFINTPNLVTIPIERKSSFTWESFDLIGNVVDDPSNFSVLSSSPITTLDQLAAYARSKPGQVTVGTTGVGSDDHLAMLMFEKIAGVKMNHVPFKGAADVRAATLGKQIDVAAVNIGEALQATKGGAPFRNFGPMSVARTDLAPEIPT
ncbi:MAG TPA: tripartite tricarboxylate transporter substrate binding protein, partial [Burkholderiaceae bacterium]|nr:tripartite tricarboxylate transporter substrate binding protein [Burkholderiaceae bacterium]